MFRGRTPGLGRLARRASEAAIVVGDEAAQDAVGGVEIAGLRQTQFAGEAVLEHAPETLDASFGLRALGGDESDAELFQGATELSGLALAGELFLQRPVIVVAGEDAAAIAVEGHRDTVAAQEALEQVEIAFGGFGRKELGSENFPGSIVLHAQSGEEWAAAFEPIMRRAVELEQFSFASGTQTALAMSRRAAFAGRADAAGAEQATQGFAAEGEALLLDELLMEMVIVEARIARACQSEERARVRTGRRR